MTINKCKKLLDMTKSEEEKRNLAEFVDKAGKMVYFMHKECSINIPKIGIKELLIKSLLYISYPGYFGRSSKYNRVDLDSPSR